MASSIFESFVHLKHETEVVTHQIETDLVFAIVDMYNEN